MTDSQKDSNTLVYYAPAEAARVLGVSAATQRRMARIYEDTCGELHRNERGDRLWTREALERMVSARELHQAGRAVSIEAGLETVMRGDAEPGQAVTLTAQPTAEPLELVLRELQTLRGAVEGLTAVVERLETENRALREEVKALEPPLTPPVTLSAEGKRPHRAWLSWLIERLQRWE